MGRRFENVSLITDYGLVDEFVGVLKAVIRDIAPHAQTIDLTHNITPFDVRAGSLALARCVSYIPSGVVVGVVDPGVGGSRKAIAIEVADGEAVFVGPDNGLLAPAVAMAGGAQRAVDLTNEEYHLLSHGVTFAGRDIFAPVAAHLCNGVALGELGPEVDPFTLRPGVLPLPREEDDRLLTEVLWVDRFGNLQLNVSAEEIEHLGDTVTLRFRDEIRTGKRRTTYGEITAGEIGLVIDSYGLMSLALDRSSAAEELRLGPGDEVSLSTPV